MRTYMSYDSPSETRTRDPFEMIKIKKINWARKARQPLNNSIEKYTAADNWSCEESWKSRRMLI